MKRVSTLFIILAVCTVMMLQACSPDSPPAETDPYESTQATEDTAPKDWGKYENIAFAEVDAMFEFNTDLPEKQQYPLSTGGKTYYVSSSGSSSNDGLSPERPITLADVASLELTAGCKQAIAWGDEDTAVKNPSSFKLWKTMFTNEAPGE